LFDHGRDGFTFGTGSGTALFDRLVDVSLPGRRGEQAWRALLQAHATLTRQLDTDLNEHTGLHLADFDVLAQLGAADGQLRMTELAARTLISRSGLTAPSAEHRPGEPSQRSMIRTCSAYSHSH
jgi:hypothetical protein